MVFYFKGDKSTNQLTRVHSCSWNNSFVWKAFKYLVWLMIKQFRLLKSIRFSVNFNIILYYLTKIVEQLGKMFKNYCTNTRKFPLMSMGGWAEGLVCAGLRARNPICVNGNFPSKSIGFTIPFSAFVLHCISMWHNSIF